MTVPATLRDVVLKYLPASYAFPPIVRPVSTSGFVASTVVLRESVALRSAASFAVTSNVHTPSDAGAVSVIVRVAVMFSPVAAVPMFDPPERVYPLPFAVTSPFFLATTSIEEIM